MPYLCLLLISTGIPMPTPTTHQFHPSNIYFFLTSPTKLILLLQMRKRRIINTILLRFATSIYFFVVLVHLPIIRIGHHLANSLLQYLLPFMLQLIQVHFATVIHLLNPARLLHTMPLPHPNPPPKRLLLQQLPPLLPLKLRHRIVRRRRSSCRHSGQAVSLLRGGGAGVIIEYIVADFSLRNIFETIGHGIA